MTAKPTMTPQELAQWEASFREGYCGVCGAATRNGRKYCSRECSGSHASTVRNTFDPANRVPKGKKHKHKFNDDECPRCSCGKVAHHWQLDSPDGSHTVGGTCKRCGTEREFVTAYDGDGFSNIIGKGYATQNHAKRRASQARGREKGRRAMREM